MVLMSWVRPSFLLYWSKVKTHLIDEDRVGNNKAITTVPFCGRIFFSLYLSTTWNVTILVKRKDIMAPHRGEELDPFSTLCSSSWKQCATLSPNVCSRILEGHAEPDYLWITTTSKAAAPLQLNFNPSTTLWLTQFPLRPGRFVAQIIHLQRLHRRLLHHLCISDLWMIDLVSQWSWFSRRVRLRGLQYRLYINVGQDKFWKNQQQRLLTSLTCFRFTRQYFTFCECTVSWNALYRPPVVLNILFGLNLSYIALNVENCHPENLHIFPEYQKQLGSSAQRLMHHWLCSYVSGNILDYLATCIVKTLSLHWFRRQFETRRMELNFFGILVSSSTCRLGRSWQLFTRPAWRIVFNSTH